MKTPCVKLSIDVFLSTLSLRRATQSDHPRTSPTEHFYPRSPCGERRKPKALKSRLCVISIHALLAESDYTSKISGNQYTHFYPRSPCGERLNSRSGRIRFKHISIHALLAESDGVSIRCVALVMNFYPRSPCGERPGELKQRRAIPIFLSTLSLRRATRPMIPTTPPAKRFLSTLSLRRATSSKTDDRHKTRISIHALLAESDYAFIGVLSRAHKFLSTLSLRRATTFATPVRSQYSHFYPRSPCGERLFSVQNTVKLFYISIHALLAESDLKWFEQNYNHYEFLSTLSLRRATAFRVFKSNCFSISIHALLAESDSRPLKRYQNMSLFLSTLSLRRATR